MRTLPSDTGPPVINASAVGSYPHGTKGDDVNPASATENARLGLVSQVCGTRVPLVRLDLALTPEDWHWLRALAKHNNQRQVGPGVHTSWTEFSRSLGLAANSVNSSAILP